MGSCVSRSTKNVQHENRISAKEKAIPEIASLSPAVVRSNESLQVAEPSDGSFAVYYPELEYTSHKLPKNEPMKQKTIPENASQSAALARSSELLQVTEPSDGSFAVYYPELEYTSHKLPKTEPMKQKTIPENSSQSAALARSSEMLQVSEPSDGSFAVYYPELEFSSHKLPQKGTNASVSKPSDLTTTKRVEQRDQQDSFPTKAFRQTSLTESEKSSESNPISNSGTASTSSPTIPIRMYAREA